ncbi:MAG: response regulator [Pseudomonadota bacterium]|nr:response regulator [Pseudomonadota bacterium]
MKTCLVVDDSRVVRKVARKILEEINFICTEAEDGKEAMQICAMSMPDVILLDWNMPVMSGIAFLRRLRKMTGGDKPKVVFCTTENNLAHIQEALSAGANEYIMKPFDGEIIETKFAQIGLI